MKLIAYQAALSNGNNVKRVQAVKPAIEGIGGKVSIAPPTKVGMVLVTLLLPEGYSPDQFLLGIPFYPV